MFFSYEGLVDSGTFKLASATVTKIKADPKQAIGKVVTITGNEEVGYGADAAEPFGVVTQVEPYSTNSSTMVVTVEWGKTFEGIACAGSEAAGKALACDGKGGLKESATYTGCKALSVDTSSNTCTIKI